MRPFRPRDPPPRSHEHEPLLADPPHRLDPAARPQVAGLPGAQRDCPARRPPGRGRRPPPVCAGGVSVAVRVVRRASCIFPRTPPTSASASPATARQFPAIFGLLADGRLHLTAVMVLTPYLTAQNADDLLVAAAHKSKAQIEQLLAERFPQPDLPALDRGRSRRPGLLSELAPEPVKFSPAEQAGRRRRNHGPGSRPSRRSASPSSSPWTRRPTTTCSTRRPCSGTPSPAGDPAQVIARALKTLIAQLEQRKFAEDRPAACAARPSDNARHVPAEVKRAVWERDGGRCTFVGESGHRCEARTRLEFDHVEPVASGGRATVGQPAAALPGAQPVRGGAALRAGLHADQAGDGREAPAAGARGARSSRGCDSWGCGRTRPGAGPNAAPTWRAERPAPRARCSARPRRGARHRPPAPAGREPRSRTRRSRPALRCCPGPTPPGPAPPAADSARLRSSTSSRKAAVSPCSGTRSVSISSTSVSARARRIQSS